MNPVIESSEFIMKTAKYVSFGKDEAYEAAAKIVGPLVAAWKPESWATGNLHPASIEGKPEKINWIFLIDTLNFAFWTPEGKKPFTVRYNNKDYTGYWSLCAAISRAIDDGKDILNPEFWVTATIDDWKDIFRSETETEVPLIEKRLEVTREAGRVLVSEYHGSALELVESMDHSALNLIEFLHTHINSYKDECEYNGRNVYFLKRAQILAADLHFGCIGGDDSVSKACQFYDIDKLTMFADYRVPQVLNYMGLIVYSNELLEEMTERPHFPSGSQMECEIRAASILSVERLKTHIGCCSVLIDFVLWTYAKEHSAEMAHIPIHKTKSVFY